MSEEGPFAADVAAVQAVAAVRTILEVVCRTTGMGFAAVARVSEDRWVACAVLDAIDFGLAPGGELKVDTTLCHEIRESGEAIVIDHVAHDEAFAAHPTPALYGFQSYISVPIIRADGGFFGTLCAIDPSPARLKTPEIIGMFKLFAELIAFHLDAQTEIAEGDARLAEARRLAEQRERFIAMLGHDLRNPLASIDAGVRLLQTTPLDEKAGRVAGLMQASVWRMTALIDNVLDFARGRLGSGLAVGRQASDLAPTLAHVIAELQSVHPGRKIEARIEIDRQVEADPVRLSQLLSNLVANALTHGAPDAPVRVRAGISDGVFEIAVANGGDRIPEAALERLFQPFERGAVRPDQQGLGLGLYIASEIARAHHGTLSVASSDEQTVFTFRMPAKSGELCSADLSEQPADR
jgi:signal transduction histidine kinase